MPAYMLKDIGVTRDTAGRFCHYNDYGMLVELAPDGQETGDQSPMTDDQKGRGTAYAAQ